MNFFIRKLRCCSTLVGIYVVAIYQMIFGVYMAISSIIESYDAHKIPDSDEVFYGMDLEVEMSKGMKFLDLFFLLIFNFSGYKISRIFLSVFYIFHCAAVYYFVIENFKAKVGEI